MKYQIDKDIPIPPVYKSVWDEQFNSMEVGDSFFAPKPDHRTIRQWQQDINAKCYHYLRPKHKGWTTQRSEPTAVTPAGIRVWRTK